MNRFYHAVFPSIIIESQCDSYDCIRKDLIDWIYDYQSITKSVNFSNRGGWQSPGDFHNQKSFSQFKDYILDNAFQSLTHYNRRFSLANMWININKRGDYNVSHCHPGSDLSGIFWIKTSENCGGLIFPNPQGFIEFNLMKTSDINFKKKYNYTERFAFIPKEGTLVLCSSHLRHHVEENQSNEDRISIAFNLNT
jgi:uncharacterized protein (TIGR02466 family)